MAYAEMEPFGSHYDDLRAGTIASMVANVNRNTKVRRDPFMPLDFAPWNDSQREAASPEPILMDDLEEQSRLVESMMFPPRQ